MPILRPVSLCHFLDLPATVILAGAGAVAQGRREVWMARATRPRQIGCTAAAAWRISARKQAATQKRGRREKRSVCSCPMCPFFSHLFLLGHPQVADTELLRRMASEERRAHEAQQFEVASEGSTAVVIVITGGAVTVANVGDSMAYLARRSDKDGQWEQVGKGGRGKMWNGNST